MSRQQGTKSVSCVPRVIKEGSNVPRKGHNQKRDVLADPIYNNKVVTKLINNIMLDGKRVLHRRSCMAHLTVWLRQRARTPSKYLRKQ